MTGVVVGSNRAINRSHSAGDPRRDHHLVSRTDRSSLKFEAHLCTHSVEIKCGGQLFSKKIKHSRPSIRGDEMETILVDACG